MSSNPEPVLSDCAGRVGRVTLNRPTAMNAVTVELAVALERALVSVADEADVVVVRGAGGNFSVGGDVAELERLRGEGPDALAQLFESFGRALSVIAGLPVPVLAAVEGHALAGGFELMQACDLAIVSEEARIGDHHARFGMVPGGGSSQRLPRLIGRQRALGLLLTGDGLSGAEAAQWGLAYRAVPAADFDSAVAALAQRLAGGKREATARTKELVYAGLEGTLEPGLAREREAVVEHLLRDDAMDRFAALKGG